jgi:hypothetical protein
LTYDQGKLYELKESPPDEQRKDTVYFNGKYYTYKKVKSATETEPSLPLFKSMLTKQFCLKLRDQGYRFRKRDLAFRAEDAVEQPHTDVFDMFNGFKLRTMVLFKRLFLCVDPHLIILTRASAAYLLEQGISPEKLSGFSVRFKDQEGMNIDGFLIATAPGNTFESRLEPDFLCQIKSYRDFKEELVPTSRVLPESRPEVLQALLDGLGRKSNVVLLQRQYSFLGSKTASLERLKRTLQIITQLQELFPLKFGEFKVTLEGEPARIKW